MKVKDLCKPSIRRVEFSKKSQHIVPCKSGAYVLSTYFEEILYIGVSQNLQRRMLEHLNDQAKVENTPLGKAFWISYLLCSEKDFRFYEKGWIFAFQLAEGKRPYYNKIDPPC